MSKSQFKSVGNGFEPVVSLANLDSCGYLPGSCGVCDCLKLPSFGVKGPRFVSESGCDAVVALAVGVGVVRVVGVKSEWEGG